MQEFIEGLGKKKYKEITDYEITYVDTANKTLVFMLASEPSSVADHSDEWILANHRADIVARVQNGNLLAAALWQRLVNSKLVPTGLVWGQE
jgi:hypothetical protein